MMLTSVSKHESTCECTIGKRCAVWNVGLLSKQKATCSILTTGLDRWPIAVCSKPERIRKEGIKRRTRVELVHTLWWRSTDFSGVNQTGRNSPKQQKKKQRKTYALYVMNVGSRTKWIIYCFIIIYSTSLQGLGTELVLGLPRPLSKFWWEPRPCLNFAFLQTRRSLTVWSAFVYRRMHRNRWYLAHIHLEIQWSLVKAYPVCFTNSSS